MISVIILFVVIAFLIYAIRSIKNNLQSAIPVTNTPINLSALADICKNYKDNEIDLYLVSESVYEKLTDRLSEGKPLTPAMLEKNTPVKIIYTGKEDKNTIRDILPFRINGYIKSDGDNVMYDFYIKGYCFLRREERSFHTSGIKAAWLNGTEINLGDYLAELCRKAKKYNKS